MAVKLRKSLAGASSPAVYAGAAISLVICSASTANDPDDVLRRMTEWRSAISSIECESTYVQEFHQPTNREPARFNVRWVETPTKIYWKVQRNGATSEFVWEDGKQKCLYNSESKGPTQTGSIGTLHKDAVYLSPGCPWTLTYLCGVGRFPPPLTTFLRTPENAVASEATFYEKRPSVKFIHHNPGLHTPFEWIVDSSRGVLLASSVLFSTDGQQRIERRFESMTEVAPQIFFPKRIVQRIYRRGSLAETSTTTFSKVVVNPPVDPDTMRVSFAPNIQIIDRSAGTTYQTDENEQPVPGSVQQLRLSKDELDAIEAARPWYRRWTYWLAIGGILLIGLSGLAYVRRVRRVRQAAA